MYVWQLIFISEVVDTNLRFIDAEYSFENKHQDVKTDQFKGP